MKQLKTVSAVMAITLLGKLMGLWRDRLLAIAYGTGMEANAFYTASRIPRVFFDAIFASAIAVCLIPVFTRLEAEPQKLKYPQSQKNSKKKSKHKSKKTSKKNISPQEKANLFGGNFISVMSVVTALLTLLGILFAPLMVTLFAGGYDSETQALAIHLTRIMFPTVFFTGLAFSFVGILQSRDEFFMPAFISCVSNAVIIAYFYFFDDSFGIYGLSTAYLIGWSAQALIQIPSLKKINFHFKPNFSFSTPEMKQVYTLMAPVMISTWVQPINLTINTRFASYLHNGGGVSIIEIATNLYFILAGVFILSITNVIFPKLAKLTQEGNENNFQETLRQTLHVALFFTLPMSVGLGVVAEPLISLLYGGGEFDDTAIQYTATALQWISLGMAGYAIQTLVSRAYFAKEDGKTPLKAGILTILLNTLLCSLLVDSHGITGLALASAISSTTYGILLLIALQKQEGNLLTQDFTKDIGKMILASLLLKIIAQQTLSHTLPYGRIIALTTTALTGLIAYLLITYALKLPETQLNQRHTPPPL